MTGVDFTSVNIHEDHDDHYRAHHDHHDQHDGGDGDDEVVMNEGTDGDALL